MQSQQVRQTEFFGGMTVSTLRDAIAARAWPGAISADCTVLTVAEAAVALLAGAPSDGMWGCGGLVAAG